MAGSITSANATISISISGLYTQPQGLQGFAADDIFDQAAVRAAEVSMGMDGKLAGGFIFVPIPMTFAFQANSPSVAIFDAWYQAEQIAVDVYIASATVSLRSLGKKYNCSGGFLTATKLVPDARRILNPMRYEITWESVLPQPANAAAPT